MAVVARVLLSLLGVVALFGSPAQANGVVRRERHALEPADVPGSVARPPRVAFVWYLTNYEKENLACAILVSVHGIQTRHPRSNAEFVVVHTLDDDEIPDRQALHRLGVRLIHVKPPATSGSDQWYESFTKLRVAGLVDYDRLIYFDADTYPLGSLDSLFDIANFPVEVAAPRAYWLPQPFLQSGGPMVIDPRSNFFERHFKGILDEGVIHKDLPEAERQDSGVAGWLEHGIQSVASKFTDVSSSGQYAGEMDWFNAEFRDTATVLPGFHALLVGEWCAGDGVYKHWQKEFAKSPSWVLHHATLVHFIANWKPWFITTPEQLSQKCPHAQPQLLQVFQKWWAARDKVCGW